LKADRFLKEPVIYEHLGDVYLKMGEKENAKKFWKLSLKLLPGQDAVIEKLKSLGSL
jgi:predicted negative regulator of RcsB-dependent stress response